MSEYAKLLAAISDVKSELQADLKQFEKNVKGEINGFKREFNQRMDDLEGKFEGLSERVSKVEEDIANLRAEMGKIPVVKRDAIEAYDRMLSLTIDGIEHRENESLTRIFAAVATKLGCPVPPVVRLTRFKSSHKPGIEKDRRPIKALFSSLVDKETFMGNYLKAAKTLVVSCIGGFEGLTTRIYVQEMLDPTTYALKSAAVKHKRAGRLVEVTIKNLQLYVRVNKNSSLVWVGDLVSLDNLAKNKQR